LNDKLDKLDDLLDEKATGTGAIAKWALMLQHSDIFFTFKHKN
jgi:hypothetical protein